MSQGHLSRTVYTPPRFLSPLLDHTAQLSGVALGLYLISQWLTYVNVDDGTREFIRTIVQVLLLAFLAVVLLLRHYTMRTIAQMALLAALAVLSSHFTGSKTLMWFALLVVAMREETLSTISRTFVVSILIFVATVLTSWALGFASAIELTRSSGEIRYSFGFTHPNVPAMFVFLFCLSWVAMRFYRLRIWDWVLLLAMSFVVNIVTDSRTFLIATLFFLVLVAYLKSEWGRRDVKIVAVCGIVILVACVTFEIIAMIKFDDGNATLIALDDILSGRLRWAHYYYSTYGLSLMGFPFTSLSKMAADSAALTGAKLLVDMAYCNLLLGYGTIPFFVIVGAYASLFVRCVKERYGGVLLAGLITFAVVGLAEAATITLSSNFFLLAFTCLVDGRPLAEFDDASPAPRGRHFARRGPWPSRLSHARCPHEP